MKVISLWDKLKTYAKRHTFHMIMVVAIIILGVVQVSQFVTSASLYGLIKLNERSFNSYIVTNLEERTEDKNELISKMEKDHENLIEEIAQSEIRIDSRIDILDSAIKPDEKRRMLIVKIRKAISENTNTRLDIRTLNAIAMSVIDNSYKYNLPIAKILAQMKVESDFHVKAKSKAGARGLMQIMPTTLQYIEMKIGKRMNSWDIDDNINSGCFYLAEQLHEFEDYDQSLRAYNLGPDSLKKYIAGERKSLPEETQEYVPKINKWIIKFEKYGLE